MTRPPAVVAAPAVEQAVTPAAEQAAVPNVEPPAGPGVEPAATAPAPPTGGDAPSRHDPASSDGDPAHPLRGGLLVLAGMLLVALNLRAAITSLGALLDEVRGGLALSGAMAGIVTTMPTIAFAGFGALAPWLVRRFSPARVLVAAMAALAAGQALRVATGSALVFVATSALALSGIAVANILLPMVVKQHFPHRTGLVTGAYTVALTAGASAAAAAAVPIAHATGSWRAGLGGWAILAAVAVLPWLPHALRGTADPARTAARRSVGARVRPARTRLGWAMAIYFGMQSLGAYAIMGWLAQLFRDAGYAPQTAGLLLAGITAFGVPVALFMPTVAGRLRTLRPLVLGLSAALLLAYAGLALAPHRGALLWVSLVAVGHGAFPLVLAAIGLRARTAVGTVALSAFAQSTGYALAALGPLLVGLLYEATGGWTAPIGVLLAALAVQTAAGLRIARPRFIEDEIR